MTRGDYDDDERIRHRAEDKERKNEDSSFTEPYITDPYHSGQGPYADPRP